MKRKVIVCLIISVLLTAQIGVYADSLSDAQKEANRIKKEIKDNEQQVKNVEGQVSDYLSELDNLNSNIAKQNSELDGLQEKVDGVNTKIAEYEKDLQDAAQGYNKAEDMYVTRLRAIYENGIPNVIDIFFTSKGMSDFFAKMNVYTSILDYDKSLIGNMKNEKEYIDYIKKDIEIQQTQLEQLQYDVNKSKAALENTKSAKQTKVNQLNASKINLLAASKILNEKKAAADKKLQEEIEKYNSQNTGGYFSGIFAWPTPGVTRITANFGYYTINGILTAHSGTDIGTKTGTAVYAAADGKVISATVVTSDPNGPFDANGNKIHSFIPSNGYGYGNNVLLDNGKGDDGVRYSTRYAHLYKVVVSKGQSVKKGQLIGYSGNTGNSYGAHLHFEVIKNGKCVNPMSYFTKK